MPDSKIELSATEFIRLIKTGKATAKRGLVHLAEPKQFQNEMVRFIHNVVVDEDIKLENVQCDYKIHILECNLKSLWLEGCNFKSGLKIEFCNIKQDVGMKNTHIVNDFSISSTEILRDINIVWDTILDNFVLESNKICGSFWANNAKINNSLKVFYTDIKKRFHIYNKCSIGGELIIDHVTGEDLKISGIEILKDCNIWYNKFTGNIDIDRSNLYSLNFLSVSAIGISLFETTISDRLIIQLNSIANNIFVIRTTVNNELIINDTTRKELSIIESNLNILNISSLSEKISLHISHTSFKKIQTSGAINLGYLQWNNLIPKDNAVIEITNSLMGKWDIVNCDFSAVKMMIYSSKITDAFYTNTKFPNELTSPRKIKKDYMEGDVIEYEDIKNKHDILRDGYNQLKTLAQKQNDRGMYLHYQAAELRSYYRTLHWWHNFRTKFQLGAMRISNDYGTSWGLGFLFVIVSNFIFVSIAYYDRDRLMNWEGVGNYFSGYLSSIFSLITVPTYFKGSWEVNWFYFSRLFIAFGIYQTIAAFRKFGKSE